MLRRLALFFALLALPAFAQAQDFIRYYPGTSFTTPVSISVDAAPYQLSIYNTADQVTNYERGSIGWSGNGFVIATEKAGTGTLRNMAITAPSIITTGLVRPSVTDTDDLGMATPKSYRTLYLSRGLQGFKSMALTPASATTFVTIAIPQTAGANFAGGEVIYQVYETDGTDMTTLVGRAKFNCVNKAGTEGCSAIADVQTAIYTSQGADTLTCAITAVTGLVDSIGLAANCTDGGSMAETTFVIYYRLDMLQPNTQTPGT